MGGAQRTVTLGALGLFEVPLPSMPEQLRTVADLEERIAAIDVLETSLDFESEAIDALPAALLRHAFGELAA